MKNKKLVDNLSKIDDEYIEKAINIDTKEKLVEAKKGEKVMKKGNIFKWLGVGFACTCAVIAGIFLLNGKGVKPNNNGNVSEIKQMPLLTELKMSGNGLEDFDLYFLKLNNDGKNKVYSPLSIKYALEMLSEGAKGETKEQIDAILGSYKAGKYSNTKNMSFANAMFINESNKDSINKEYTDALINKFNASLIYDSFNSATTVNKWISEKTLGMINDLLTDNDVKDRFFALVNALAIDMEWVNTIQPKSMDDEFSISYKNENGGIYVSARDVGQSMDFYTIEEQRTKEEGVLVSSMEFGSAFNNYDIISVLGEDNIRKTVTDAYNEWLHAEYHDESYNIANFEEYLDKYIEDLKANYHKGGNSTDYRYYVDNNVKVFAKDLKKYNGTQLEYVQIMPTTVDLDEYIKSMKASDLQTLISKAKTPKGEDFKDGVVTQIKGLTPAFKYDYSLNLINNLNQLGIYNIFVAEKADLSGITSESVYIDSALHKAVIELSNDGIKAAAVTFLGGMGDEAGEFYYVFEVPVEVIDLTFDRPFMYLIRDKVTGEVWFTGSVYNPTTIDSIDFEALEDLY